MKKLLLSSLALIFLFSSHAISKECDIIIKDRNFFAGKIKKTDQNKCLFGLKSNKTNRIKFCNNDNAVAEVESHALAIEKIIAPKKSAIILVRKLNKGEIYDFEEEFSETHCSFVGI